MSSSNLRRNRLVFGVLCVVAAATISGYIYSAKQQAAPHLPGREQTTPVSAKPVPIASADKAAAPPVPVTIPVKSERITPARIFFRHTALGSLYGRLALVSSDAADNLQMVGEFTCEVAYVAGGRGICLKANRGMFTTYEAQLFDARTFQPAGSISLAGVPSRCRISKDGRIAAMTVFVSGHSYASADFSTQTLLVDAQSTKVIADIEEYSVTRDGEPFSSKDFNFWGVSFTPDGKQFYCTLSTNRQHFLVKGDIASKTMAVIHEQVECPSLSPDGKRIAYKKRNIVDGRLIWKTQVLDLQSRKETILTEERSVDDQLEWLGNDRVLYALPVNANGSGASTNVWVAAADGSGTPELFLRNAYSPTVEQ